MPKGLGTMAGLLQAPGVCWLERVRGLGVQVLQGCCLGRIGMLACVMPVGSGNLG